MSNDPYKVLLRKHLVVSDDPDSQRNKRRKRTRTQLKNADIIEINSQDSASQDVDSSNDSDEFEDVDIQGQASDGDSFDESDDGNHSSNVAQLYNLDKPQETTSDTLTITLKAPKSNPPKRSTVVSKEERQHRLQIHQISLAFMIYHGWIRNSWANNKSLHEKLQKYVSQETLQLLYPKIINSVAKEVLPIVKSRKFLDGLRNLMKQFRRRFHVSNKGLVRKNWGELGQLRQNFQTLTFDAFCKSVLQFKGSRDLGAQAFVALCRSVGLEARLIYSIQAPDFTSVKIENAIKPELKSSKEIKSESGSNQKFNVPPHMINAKMQILQSARSAPTQPSTKLMETDLFEDSEYPIFWIEVWNKYVKKWVSIDPISLEKLEIPPMRKKSIMEPPSTDIRNQLTYAIAYDSKGGVKDVTRRYSHYFNAKTSKKRITFRDKLWYDNLIKSISRRKLISKRDIIELKEFYDRDLCEGIPNNIADFKNHPLYALESQLKQNEAIYPKDKSSQCGLFRNKSTRAKNNANSAANVIPIYKRSSVHQLRSAKAWYMRGRVLKVGVQPLKTKQNNKANSVDEDEDEDDQITRLYAEFQTSLYNPPPITDGKVPKNAYGNIDIYTPTMVPEGGVFIQVNEKYSIKMMEQAAKLIGVDYAKAVTKFDFKGSRMPTAKEGGIVIAKQFQEALESVLEAIYEDAQQDMKDMVELNALKNWKFFLAKLRIEYRLDKEHGKVGQIHEDTNNDVYMGEAGGFEHEAGGFEPEAGGFEPEAGGFEPEAGGFEPEAGGFEPEAGGFESEAGGFEPEAGGFEPEAGGFESEAGGFEPEAGGFEPEAGGFEPEAGGFEPEAGGFEHEDNEMSHCQVASGSELSDKEVVNVKLNYDQDITKIRDASSRDIGTLKALQSRNISKDRVGETMIKEEKNANDQKSDNNHSLKITSNNPISIYDRYEDEDEDEDEDDLIDAIPDDYFRKNSKGELEFFDATESANSIKGKNASAELDKAATTSNSTVCRIDTSSSDESVEILAGSENDEFGFDYESE